MWQAHFKQEEVEMNVKSVDGVTVLALCTLVEDVLYLYQVCLSC